MQKIIISGINGRMGRILKQVIDTDSDFSDCRVVAGFDLVDMCGDVGGDIGDEVGVPVFSAPDEKADSVPEADVVIDFSNHAFVPAVLRYCELKGTPVIVATTALDEGELQKVADAAKQIAVFRSANMSLGVNLVAKMSKLAAPVVEDNFNIEIVEAHHNKKKDAPSGTAIMIADAINDSLKTRKEYVFGRHGREDAPDISELGIHAMRGGSIPGQHTVMFAGPDEVLEITHTVYSPKVFAIGALKAAAYIVGKPPGLYDMNSLIG